LQLLYRDDLNPSAGSSRDARFITTRLGGDAQLVAFAQNLVQGVRQHRKEIDAQVQAACHNWDLRRMAATDRNVLRLGAYEMLFGGTPPRVAIDEAIELARRYGGEFSPRFVNGVLDRLLKNSEALVESPAAGEGQGGSVS
jgi:N utilization substance protein B